ncbi:Uncharacterized protein PECH_003760 [Penicillium ucsense]|uniref:Uncharacterized protein n=1 Tax=Penicillium ucsense TaxID=2839758 RepID=A0A8J8VVU5_9EURO|nr:Uncharacterized protein PECM_003163 [Penicillium ucsense]KAF7729185.1 Uncharacterized protein PECH_003760 [Penicillium ucsense]
MQRKRAPTYSRMQVVLLLITFLSLISITTAATPTSFCKCTCFSNSTIIPLDASKSSSGDGDHKDALRLYARTFETSLDRDFELDRLDETQSLQDVSDGSAGTDETNPSVLAARAQTYRALTCNDCNRKFCLDYKLPICKDAKEEDVFTTCFQRDSRKDQAVVFIFIFATGGLLLWALLKPWIERYIEAARERRSYMPVGESEGS